MAQAIKYVGRTTDFKGKTLWEIVGNLKDFGVGRIVIRNMFQRYKEPCFMKILSVEAQPNEIKPNRAKTNEFKAKEINQHELTRKVKVTVEKVFRGVKYPYPIPILRASYKADYQLIPKHLEKNYTALIDHQTKRNQKLLQSHTEFPPLLKRFLSKEKNDPNVKLKIKYFDGVDSYYRVANEGEKPNVTFESGLGIPVSPNLYKTVKYD